MITKVVRCLVAFLCLALLWWCVGLILTAVGAPAIVGTIAMVLFIIIAVVFIANEFGVLK